MKRDVWNADAVGLPTTKNLFHGAGIQAIMLYTHFSMFLDLMEADTMEW